MPPRSCLTGDSADPCVTLADDCKGTSSASAICRFVEDVRVWIDAYALDAELSRHIKLVEEHQQATHLGKLPELVQCSSKKWTNGVELHG